MPSTWCSNMNEKVLRSTSFLPSVSTTSRIFPLTPGFILRALDHLAGERRCGHSVTDEADDVGAASGQSAGERVVMVAEFVSGPAHLAACGFRDLHVPVVVHRP